MRILVLAAGVLAAAIGLPVSSTAQQTVPTYFDGVLTNLQQQGYREPRLVDPQARRVVAYDRFGSEISLTIDPRDGSIESWDYVNMRDR